MRSVLLALPLLALAFGLAACSSSKSSDASIVGEWSTPIPNGSASENWYFDSDGTCGLILQQNAVSVCDTSSCTYTFDGSSLQLTTSTATDGVTTSTTYVETVTFASGGGSATVTPTGCDAGACAAATYTRIDSNGDHTCP
ncbi:MAG TPA: hypothetical protein VGG39_34090 [Polyangiaceae bacterium]|jgi:hypothetical protein